MFKLVDKKILTFLRPNFYLSETLKYTPHLFHFYTQATDGQKNINISTSKIFIYLKPWNTHHIYFIFPHRPLMDICGMFHSILKDIIHTL